MKKILVAMLIACMVLSVSTVALAFASIINENTGEAYSNLEKALAEAAAGDTIKLNIDIETSSKITITKGITLDGQNHKLIYTGSDRAIDMPNGADGAGADGDEIIIRDLNVVCSGGRGINYNASTGKLTLENVTVETTGYAINLPGKADGCEVTISGGSYTGIIALNVWGEGSKITSTDTDFTTVDNNSTEGYCAIKLNNDGIDSAEHTVVTINGGSINIKGSNADDSSFIGNATSYGVINNYTGQDIDVKTTVAVVSFKNTTDTYGLTTLQGAVDTFIKYKKTATKITLLRDVEEEVEVPEPIVLNVNGFKNDGTIYLTAENATVTTEPAKEGLNVKSKVDGLAVVYDDGVYKLVPGYTITFDANGGSGTMDPETVAKNTEHTLPANEFTAPAGKQFKAWSVSNTEADPDDSVAVTADANDTTVKEYAPGASITVDKDITVTAVWEDIPAVTISFDANGGTGTMDPVKVTVGSSYTIPENGFTAPEGKQFSCWKIWDDGVLFAGEVIEEVAENITLTAVWEDIPVEPEPSDDPTPEPTATPAPVVTPAPTAAPSAPKTGDNTNLALWMALMAISCVALLIIGKKSKASK